MKIQNTIISTSYLPPITYFQYLYKYVSIYTEHKEHYMRHSIRNRALILDSKSHFLLTVPIVRKHYSKTLVEDIKIANNNWKKQHINSIQSAYGSSPFFIHYFEDIKKIINKNYTFLIDLNYDLINYFLLELKISNTLKQTTCYLKSYPNTYLDQRNEIKVYIDSKQYIPFGHQSPIPNLSIIDLIFNLGPNSKEYIHPHK